MQRRIILINRSALTFFFIAVVLAWLWAINAARYLRPSADDYCIGVRGDLGIFGGFVNDWQTFSGFATPSFVTNALLGVPLAQLPLSVAQALPFVLAALAVALAGAALIWSSLSGLHKGDVWKLVLIGLPVIMTLWWAYLWSTYSPSGRPEPTNVALGLTHWQNLNTGYVIPIALLVLLGIWVIRREFSAWYFAAGAALVLGLVAGFAGPATALAVLVFVPFVTLGMWVMERRYWLSKGLTVWLVAAVSLAVSLNAPGTQNRSSAARSDAEVSISSIPGWFLAVVPDGFIAWFSLYWQWRSLLVVGAGLVVVYVIRLSWGTRIQVTAGLTWLMVTLFALSLSATTIVTDLLAYGAYWHQSNTTVLTFLSLLIFGIGIGGWLPLTSPTFVKIALPLVLVALALASFASAMDMSVSITDRFAAWEVGPAPIRGAIEDREVEWIGNCWDQLEVIRQGS